MAESVDARGETAVSCIGLRTVMLDETMKVVEVEPMASTQVSRLG